jgi:hypothetical protein
LISFIALPFVLSAWLAVFKDLGYGAREQKFFVLAIVGIYLVAIAAMVVRTHRRIDVS